MKICKICLVCKQEFWVIPSRKDRAKYCSYDCRDIASAKQVKHTCEYCGTIFYLAASRSKYGRGKHCSPKCQYAAIRERPSEAKTTLVCINCGLHFWRYRSWLEKNKGSGKYCSRECRDEHWKGEYNPLYINGNGVSWHGPNWQSQRRKALKRDDHTCQHCGLTQDDSLKDFGQPLVVHHIKPFRLFDDYKKANRLANLITLCHACHRESESKLQEPDRLANQA